MSGVASLAVWTNMLKAGILAREGQQYIFAYAPDADDSSAVSLTRRPQGEAAPRGRCQMAPRGRCQIVNLQQIPKRLILPNHNLSSAGRRTDAGPTDIQHPPDLHTVMSHLPDGKITEHTAGIGQRFISLTQPQRFRFHPEGYGHPLHQLKQRQQRNRSRQINAPVNPLDKRAASNHPRIE